MLSFINISSHRLLLKKLSRTPHMCPPVLQLMVYIWFQNLEFESFCMGFRWKRSAVWISFFICCGLDSFEAKTVFHSWVPEETSLHHCTIISDVIAGKLSSDREYFSSSHLHVPSISSPIKLSARGSKQCYLGWHHMVKIHENRKLISWRMALIKRNMGGVMGVER